MSTFKFHSSVGETVPWQAMYTFPTQQTKVTKSLVKLPPKNGATFTSGQILRIEFPSDNYLNALNSTLQFDLTVNSAPAAVTLTLSTAATGSASFTTTGQTADALIGYNITVTNPLNGGLETFVVVGNTTTAVLVNRAIPFVLSSVSCTAYAPVRLPQGGAHNLISRIRVLYGSLVIEDIQQYKTIARILYEMGVAPGYNGTSGGILDGSSNSKFM